mgnify:CR=1 FL=1
MVRVDCSLLRACVQGVPRRAARIRVGRRSALLLDVVEGHRAVVVHDLAVRAPHELDRLGRVDAARARVARRAEPHLLRRGGGARAALRAGRNRPPPFKSMPLNPFTHRFPPRPSVLSHPSSCAVYASTCDVALGRVRLRGAPGAPLHGLMSTLTVSLGVRALVYAHAWAERRERTSWGVPGRVRNELSVCLSVKIAPKTKRAADAIGTVRVHRELEALCRCKSGTGPRPGIVPASSGSVSVIAALSHLTCQVSVGNDGAREDCGKEKVCLPSYTLEDASRAHSGMCIECAGKAA